jgi:hypothetical protein
MASAHLGAKFRPGEVVPVSGFYACSGPRCGTPWITGIAGHTFPPTPCRGEFWILKEKRP